MNKIILVGGPPRSGKTTLAQKISKELSIPWISTDALDDIAKRYVPVSDLPRLFPKTILRQKSGGGNDEMYAAYPVEQIVDAYLVQAESVHPAIESFVRAANVEGWDYVIEGYHVTPEIVASLQTESQNISSAILITTNGDEAVQRSLKSGTKQDWLRDKTKNEETFYKVAEMITLFSKKLEEEAKSLNVKIIDTSNDFQGKISEAFELLKTGSNFV